MLANYVLLDLETTGATPLRDRITEIALIQFKDGVEVDRWQTLVNPEMNIPDFIQSLTGITNAMVEDAPTFEQVAGELLDYLDDAVMCAHNVRFDHGFLKTEFKRIGITLKQKVLCTVKLSRKLYPQYKSHGLSAIIERHNFVCTQRHRAMGDVEVMAQLIELARNELGLEALETAVAELSKNTSLPSGLDDQVLDDIPETSGVYLFYGENNLPLYIGKSVNLRARVMSHFSSDHSSTKEMRISQEIKHIDWIETAGEFGALLLESRLVKERQPIHNRQLRRERQLCSWLLSKDPKCLPLLTLVREDQIIPENMANLFGTFRSKRHAMDAIRNIADAHHLCLKVLGLEAGKGACFGSQIKRCKGVCLGKENAEIHYLRVQQALLSIKFKSWPFKGRIAVKEYNPDNQKTELHVFDQWRHLDTLKSEIELHELDQSKQSLAFDLDTYHLLAKHLSKGSAHIISL
jgi:DNA polymerase-3 subunit epsilon